MLAHNWVGLGVLAAIAGAITWRVAAVRIGDADPDRSGPGTERLARVGFGTVIVGVCVAVAAACSRCYP